MVNYAEVPRPKRDKIETVDESHTYAYDPAANQYVALKVNADGELIVDASGGGAVDVSDRDGRVLGNVDVIEGPLDAALGSNATDHLLVSVEDTKGAQIDPATSSDLSTEQPRESRSTTLSGLQSGQDTTAASGSPEAVNGGSSLSVPNGATLRVKALPSNTGNAYVGAAGVTTGSGYPLAAGEEIDLSVSDVSSVYVDVDTGGEGVAWVVEQ